MSKEIYLDAPNVGKLEKYYLNYAIDKGFVSTAGPFVAEFEKKFAKYINIKKAVSTQSGTTAIHIVLHELGIGKGDEVIVPALTFIATVNPVLYVGAKPVFVDVDNRTWNIDPEQIEKRITKKTKAIIPVNLYGNPCDITRISEIAKRHNIYVIEDATESLGAKYEGMHTGTLGDFGCFSFNGNKIITTGGGGMVVGRDEEKLKHIKFLINQAKDESKEYDYPEIGFNGRMTNIEAALGLAQLERIEEFLNKKKMFHDIYERNLKDIKFIRFQEEYKGAESSRWLSCVTFTKDINIVSIQRELKKKNIITRKVFTPIIEFLPYRKYKQSDYKNSYQIYRNSLCFPSSTLNSEDDIHFVCKTLKEFI